MFVTSKARLALAGLMLSTFCSLPARAASSGAAGPAASDGLTTALPTGAGPRIVNGLKSQAFPTTGALLYSGGAAITASNAFTQCSGTLIGCRTFLTAAHCVVDDTAASHYWVYLQHGGIFPVASVAYNPGYHGASSTDVAIVKLTTDVTGIDPTPINSTHNLAAMGSGLAGVIAGFGQTFGTGNDYGVKRYGDVETSSCNTAVTGGEGNDKLVCWDFATPVGLPGSDSNTCNGDSGGPLFMNFGSGDEVVGVTSEGTSTDCLPHDHSWDSSVYYNAAYLTGQLGADSTTTCGGLAPVGDPGVIVTADSGTLSPGNPDDSFVVTLSGTPSLLRVTLNGKDDGTFNPNFYLKQGGGGASPASYNCKGDGASVFGACEIVNPAPGDWSILVTRAAGTGDYQVTTTVFGGDPPVCGNDVRESGEQCDGSDDSACNGLCEPGCLCPAPVCGNDVGESGEQCDGSDDGACPGACDGSCACPSTCSEGDLYGLTIVSTASRLVYKAYLYDTVGLYADLDPRNGLSLDITDHSGTVSVGIPAADPGWARSDLVRRRFRWKGDGSIDGLRAAKFQRRTSSQGDYWLLLVKGRLVPGGGSIDTGQLLDFNVAIDGTCHLETW